MRRRGLGETRRKNIFSKQRSGSRGTAIRQNGFRPLRAYLIPVDQRKAAYIYLRKVAAAGGYRNYERDHLNALSGIFVPKFSRVLPPEMVRRVVEYAFDVGGH